MSLAERLKQVQIEIEHNLIQGVIPFWQRAYDQEYGGFLTNFDGDGKSTDCPHKLVVTQARLIWWFSRLARTYRQEPEHSTYKKLATSGLDFFYTHFWDSEHKAWFTMVDRAGKLADDGKFVYGQSFAIYALAEYALAFNDAKALDYASQTFDCLQMYATDIRYGGYLDYFERNWVPTYKKDSPHIVKSFNTYLHLTEAFSSLFLASQLPYHYHKLVDLVHLIADKLIDPATGAGLNYFERDWKPTPTFYTKASAGQPSQHVELTSYGHNIELAWLLHLAVDIAKLPFQDYREKIQRLVDHTLKYGVDWTYGGLYSDGKRETGEPLILDKIWWCQAEALIGFLDGYELFKDEQCLKAFVTVWEFLQKHMITPAGEWKSVLTHNGDPIDDTTGHIWHASYHTGRALLESSQRLARLKLS